MPAGLRNFDLSYRPTYFCSYLPPINIIISIKNTLSCSNWMLFTIMLKKTPNLCKFVYESSPIAIPEFPKKHPKRHLHMIFISCQCESPGSFSTKKKKKKKNQGCLFESKRFCLWSSDQGCLTATTTYPFYTGRKSQ